MLGGIIEAELLHESARGTNIYRAIRERDSASVFIRHQSARNLRPEARTLRQEYDLLRQADIDHGIEFQQEGGDAYLISEGHGGALLETIVASAPMNIGDFLAFAIASATTLKAITDAGLVYGNICPKVLAWSADHNKVSFLEYCAASFVELTHPVVSRLEASVDYGYIAPEQTGRLNVAIDHRSDIYSLGCVFYYCLTKRPPFQADDDLSRLYAHLARSFPEADSYPETVPAQIIEIIKKLTRKAPDQRYQTINGLLHDLTTCREAFEEAGTIDPFPLASQDTSGKLALPDRLFGREADTQTLKGIIECSTRGRSELLLVSGLSGIGKSSFIESAQRPVLEQRGFYVSSIFDRYKSRAPYASLGMLLDDLVLQAQSGAFGDAKAWSERISASVGPGLSLLSRLSLRLKDLVPLPRFAPELPASDIQRQLSLAIRRFLAALATPEHQVFLVLDDAQWADTASMRILEDLLLDNDLSHIVVCLAYRSEEVDASHTLSDLISKVSNGSFRVTSIVLAALNEADTRAFLSAALKEGEEQVGGLATVLHQQSAGNPLVLQVLLKYLIEQNLLNFDAETKAWLWDQGALAKVSMSADLAELMLERLNTLPNGTKKLLNAAAVIGADFTKGLLQSLLNSDKEAFEQHLEPALKAGLLLPSKLEHSLGFVHARVEQAAYKLNEHEERERLHVQLARLFLSKEHIADTALFQAIRHLNIAADQLSDAERAQVQQLNYRAGKLAERGAAFEVAFEYYSSAVAMLTSEIWADARDMAMGLCLSTLSLAAVFNDRAAVTMLSDIVRENSDDVWELIHIDRAELLTANIDLDVAKSVQAGASALSRIGAKVSLTPSPMAILIEIIKTKLVMTGKGREKLLNLPWIKDEKTKLISELLTDVAPAAYVSNTEFWLVLVLRLVRHTVKEGLSPASVQAISSYGVLADEIFDDFKSMKMMTEVADTLATQPASPFPNRTLFATCYYNYHRFLPISEVIDRFKAVAAQAFEDGDIHWGCYSYNNIPNLMIASGQNLLVLKEQVDGYAETVKRHGNFASLAALNIPRHFLHKMTGQAGDPVEPHSEIVSQNDLDTALSNGQRYTTALYLAGQIYIEVFFGRYAAAREYAVKYSAFEGNLIGTVTGVRTTALVAIAYLKSWDHLTTSDRKDGRKTLPKALKLLKVRAKHAPDNYAHLLTLVRATDQARQGKNTSALALYEHAGLQAEKGGFLQDMAWALEQMARLSYQLGRERTGTAYLTQAIAAYQRWGAAPICGALQTEFEGQLPERNEQEQSSSRFDRFDIDMVAEASRLLGSEMHLPELLRTLMRLMLASSGAGRGVLLLKSEKGITPAASAEVGDEVLSVQVLEELQSTPPTFPQSVVDKVATTRDTLVLANEKAVASHELDSYIRDHQPKSILALPLVHKGELLGVLYMENRLTAGAFTPQRCELSGHIAGQAALSIENAQLYAEMTAVNLNLENRVKERTEAVTAYSALLDTTMTSMSEGLVTFDANNKLSLWNNRFEELLGTVGFVPAKGMDRSEIFKTLDDRGATTGSNDEIRLPNGTILVHRAKPSNDGSTVEVFVDVTTDREREMALEQAHKTLKDTQTQLVQAEKMASLGSLVAGVAHEINTPLGTSITASSSLNARTQELLGKLEQGGMTKRGLKDFLDDAQTANMIIQSNLARAADLVKSFKQVAADRTHDERRKFELGGYFEEIAASIAPIWKANGHTLTIHSDKEVTVESYPGALAQVITNLVSNSVEHGFRELPNRSIKIEISINHNMVTVIYYENGLGMAEDVKENAFEPFFTTNRASGATGLGLHLVYNVITSQLGGTISLESEQGAGSKFTITMPKSAPAGQKPRESSSQRH
ncbi:AAA family ATPase [Kordiimonas sp.]|uniref:AAA family ATPase n=1 Tax=Kordiimonas sp. TaxID=1970157 RepID=UPI003A92F76A